MPRSTAPPRRCTTPRLSSAPSSTRAPIGRCCFPPSPSRWPSFVRLTNLVQPQEEPEKGLYTLARFCPAVAGAYPASFHYHRCCNHNSNAGPWRSGAGGGGCRHRPETPILLARARARAKLAGVFISVRPVVVLCGLCCRGGGRKNPVCCIACANVYPHSTKALYSWCNLQH